jgi:hypothetical protein
MESLTPPVAGWRSFPRAFVSLVALGLAVVAGEWLVHQLEYLTEYGPRFGGVMATTPHRLYMVPLGIVLGVGVASLFALAAATLALTQRARTRLVRLLPPRVARHVPSLSIRLAPRSVAATALVLAACQTTFYVVQENVEWFSVTGQWRGLSVVFSPQHATLIPFQLLIAGCGALVLWTASSFVRQSRHAVQVARVLVAALTPRSASPRLRRVWRNWVPDLRLASGAAGPRAPPLI